MVAARCVVSNCINRWEDPQSVMFWTDTFEGVGMKMNLRTAADWAEIGHFLIVAGGVVLAALSAILGWVPWKSLSVLDWWLLSFVLALAASGIVLGIMLGRAQAAAQQDNDRRAAEEKQRADQAATDRERAISRPEEFTVFDVSSVALIVRSAQATDLRITFKFNCKQYPDTLTYHGFAVTGLSFGSRILPRQNADDAVPCRLGSIGELPVDFALGATQTDEILKTLPPEYPAEPRNFSSAHQFQVVGVLKFRDSSGRDRLISVDRSVFNATLQVQPLAWAALAARAPAAAAAPASAGR